MGCAIRPASAEPVVHQQQHTPAVQSAHSPTSVGSCLADNLDPHGSPIRYGRRRRLIGPTCSPTSNGVTSVATPAPTPALAVDRTQENQGWWASTAERIRVRGDQSPGKHAEDSS